MADFRARLCHQSQQQLLHFCLIQIDLYPFPQHAVRRFQQHARLLQTQKGDAESVVHLRFARMFATQDGFDEFAAGFLVFHALMGGGEADDFAPARLEQV